jgi:tetratricopeptide (TPR) repeat protein
MTDSPDFKYRAFLSHSHADTASAKWLHSHLESFPLRGLAGRETALGQVPKSLNPIFRDRDDFSAGLTLKDQTIAALDASAALIVLCSPASVRSRYVNEEIRIFKHRRPERPIVPVIVCGKPDGAAQECFPPALRFELDNEGKITDRMAAPSIAADVREDGKGDGRELALAKVVAALTGLPPDEVFRRAERARKRQAIVRDAIAAGVVILAGVGAYFAHPPKKQSLAITDTAAKCASRLPAGQAAEGSQNALEQCITAAEGHQKDAPADPHEGETASLTDQAKPEVAEPPQVETTQNGGGTLDRTKKAAEGDPRAEHAAKANANSAGSQRDLSVSYENSGDELAAKGELADALKAYRDGLAIADGLAKAESENAEWQRNLSISHNKVGDVLLAQGAIDDALKAYRESLALRESLAKADPANAGLQHDLSVSYDKVADVLVAEGAIDDALKAYRDGLAIAGRLTKADPANVQWQRDLSVFHNKVGDVLVDKGALDDALQAYRDGLAIRERLIKTDPGNAQWLADLAASHGKLGQLLVRMGNKAEGRRMFARGKAIVAPFAEKSGHQLWIGYLKAFDENLAALDKTPG